MYASMMPPWKWKNFFQSDVVDEVSAAARLGSSSADNNECRQA